MDIRSFREKSVSEQILYLYTLLDANGGTRIDDVRSQLFDNGHVLSSHFGLSSDDMLLRTVSEIKSVSCFDTKDDAISFVESLLYEDETAKKIVKWLDSRDARPLEIEMEDMGEPVGKGVDINLREKETPTLTIVLQKTHDVLNEFGFYVKTAYPNIESKKAIYTGKDYKKEVKNIIKEEHNELCRGFWGLKINGFVPHISNKNAEVKIVLHTSTKDHNYTLNFSKYAPVIIVQSEINKPEKIKRYRNKYDLDLPLEIQSWAEKATDIYDTYVKDRNVNTNSTLTQHNVFYDDMEK